MDVILETLKSASSWLSLLPRITIRNLAEIVIISVLVYEILVWIKNTRAWILLKGLLVVLAFAVAASVLRLTTISWIIRNFTTIAVTALLIVFQPELICIGGGISKAGDLLLEPLRAIIAEESYTRTARRQTRLTVASLGNDAGIIGAALLPV